MTITTMQLTEPLLVEDTSRELDMSKVSHDAVYLAARLEFAIGKAVGRLLFWFVAVPALLAIGAVVLGWLVAKR
jgi:hypothetical protein